MRRQLADYMVRKERIKNPRNRCGRLAVEGGAEMYGGGRPGEVTGLLKDFMEEGPRTR